MWRRTRTGEGVARSVRAGVDSVEHCTQLTSAVAREMKERGTFRGPTISAVAGIIGHLDQVAPYVAEKAGQVVGDAERAMAVAIRTGVRHVCSTDAGTPFNPHGSAPDELIRMVGWGLTPLQALIAATSHGAELLRTPEVGSVAPGMLADLNLYDDDPVDDIEATRSPRSVWKGGRPVGGRKR